MNGAPPGFIALDNNVIVNVREIWSVKQQDIRRVDPEWEVKRARSQEEHLEKLRTSTNLRYESPPWWWDCPNYLPITEWQVIVNVGTLTGVKSNCSLVQFSAYMIEAMEESK